MGGCGVLLQPGVIRLGHAWKKHLGLELVRGIGSWFVMIMITRTMNHKPKTERKFIASKESVTVLCLHTRPQKEIWRGGKNSS